MLAIISTLATLAVAVQGQTETVLGAVIFSRHGDRTPLFDENSVLTSLGAEQSYNAGTFFRNRYVNPPQNSTAGAIQGINTYQLDNIQLDAETLVDEYVVASAQAFLQGLYPPTNQNSSDAMLEGVDILANGTISQAPLNGYQYPQLQSLGPLDPGTVWIDGVDYCPNYQAAAAAYNSSPQSVDNQNANANFYNTVYDLVFGSSVDPALISYYEAYEVYDYVNYQYIHNSTIQKVLSSADLERLRNLASAQLYGQLGNTSDPVLPIGGAMLATKILSALYSIIESGGVENKLAMYWGYEDVPIAFAALAQLPSVDPNFEGLPEYASSMVFELFSNVETNGTFPTVDDLYVRFLFRNGTDASDQLISYPLFGRPLSQTDMSFGDFQQGLEDFLVGSVGEWCAICGSLNYYCAVFDPDGPAAQNLTTAPATSPPAGMKPAIAGVIGAFVTLAVIALAIGAAALLGGVRLRRTTKKRRSDLSGFKKSEKLASDPDLTSGKVDPATGRGHERVGSWELKNGADTQFGALTRPESVHRDHPDDDDLGVNPFTDPVKPHETV